ncbi:regucalcin-like [Pectinophora gossypiella]|uniref:regucalcin-like n=1 Tax=Pectinophora gossypiella TaxID=13191 RepID=UPI00214F0751|nr:regucalcin-like [Pectinophora gossypiella]
MVLPVANSTRLLVSSKSQVFLLDWASPGKPSMQLLADLAPLQPGTILNEGKADARGRLWAGTKGPQSGDRVEIDQGALYSLEPPCYQPQVQLKPVTLSNGLVWSLNNSVLYYIDSYTNRIDAFDFDLEWGRISKRRTILDISQWGYDDGIPDGMTIDRDGLLWVAIFIHGMVIRVDPDVGRVVNKYDLPVLRATSMTWAGPDLEELVVTTSRRNLLHNQVAAAPLSGTLIALQNLGTGGVPDHKFVFDT